MFAFALRLDWLDGYVFVTHALDVANARGSVELGLDVEGWSDRLDVGGSSTAGGVSFDLPVPVDVDHATAIATNPAGVGATLAGAAVEVVRLRIVDGAADWNDARVLLSGYVAGFEFDTDDDLLSIDVEPYEFETLHEVPSPAEAVTIVSRANTAGTWEDLDPLDPTLRIIDGSIGRAYPVVFGQPRFAERPIACTPAVPLYEAILASDQVYTLLVSRGVPHKVGQEVTLVWRGDDDEGSLSPVFPQYRRDAQGQPVTVLDLEPLAVPRADVEYFISWDSPFSPSRGLGSVLAELLDLSGLRHDKAALSASLEVLDRYRLDGYLDEPAEVLDWLQDRVLGVLPVARTDVGEGLRLEPVRWDATAADAVARIEVGDGAADRGPYRVDGVGRPLRVVVRYAQDAESEQFAGQISRTSSSAPDAAPGRPTRTKTVELLDVFERATAELVADYHLWLERPATRVDVDLAADDDEWSELRAGDAVVLTDASVGFDGQVALVEAIEWSDEPTIRVTLLMR